MILKHYIEWISTGRSGGKVPIERERYVSEISKTERRQRTKTQKRAKQARKRNRK